MTLLELLHLMREKWYLMVLFPLLFAGATAGYCWGFMTNDYTASTSLYILTKTSNNSTNNNGTVTSSDMSASQQLANDISVLAKSETVQDAAANQLGMSSLDGYKVSVSSATTNRVIQISVTGKKPESVAAVANAVSDQTAKKAVSVMDLEAVNVVEKASTPTEPSGPKRLMYTGVAFLAGLFVAIALIVLLDMLNTTVRTPEEAEEMFGLPVLGRIPKVKGM